MERFRFWAGSLAVCLCLAAQLTAGELASDDRADVERSVSSEARG